MPVIYSTIAATHAATELISALKNPAPDASFESLGTEKLDALRKLVEIYQCQITFKNLRQLKHRPK